MKSVFLSLATVAVHAATAFAQASPGFTINTPSNVVVCEPVLLSWSGGTPPYSLSVLPGSSPTGAALEDLGTQNGTSFTWDVNIAAGTQIGLTLRDSTGLIAQTAPFSVNSGADTTCVGKSLSGSAGSATVPPASAPASAPATAPASPTTTAPAAGTTAKPAATTASATGAANSPSTSKNSAYPTQVVQVGAAGVVGAAVLALLA
jgi:hypothetical protein